MGDQEFVFAVRAIVPEDLWQLANHMIDLNRKTSRRNAKHDYLFASSKHQPLLCCLVCHEQGKEYMMGGRIKPRPEHTKDWRHYRCNNSRGIDHSVSAEQRETAI
jgi:hypothetical protein